MNYHGKMALFYGTFSQRNLLATSWSIDGMILFPSTVCQKNFWTSMPFHWNKGTWMGNPWLFSIVCLVCHNVNFLFTLHTHFTKIMVPGQGNLVYPCMYHWSMDNLLDYNSDKTLYKHQKHWKMHFYHFLIISDHYTCLLYCLYVKYAKMRYSGHLVSCLMCFSHNRTKQHRIPTISESTSTWQYMIVGNI